MRTVWALVGQSLAYIDLSQPAPENWELRLTPAGLAALRDEEYNPDDPAGYLARLLADLPDLGSIERAYVQEALGAYTARLYIACTVMLGTASEAVCLALMRSFAGTLDSQEKETFRALLDDPRRSYSRKFTEFRKKLEARRSKLPSDHLDGLDLSLNSVLELLRVNRNDAGHPTGKTFDRGDCFVSLRMAARLFRKIFALKNYFETEPPAVCSADAAPDGP